ncbi:uncharacterized protein TNCV_1628471 [Trichonephila clavipes]|nr:uncharacterized protein TNCV_1628471 [Trichonephila clavipes]
MEIKTGRKGSNSSRHESSSFKSVQRRSNKSQYGRKKVSGIKGELEGKGISFKKDQGKRHTGNTDQSGPVIRSPPGSWAEPSRKLKMSRKETIEYKRSRDSGSGGPERKQRKGQNNQGEKRQPKNGTGVESRPTIEMKTQQGGPVRARNSRGKHYNPYIEEQLDQATRIPEEEVVNNKMVRKGKEERIPTGTSSWRS